MILAHHITMWSSLFIITPYATSSFLCLSLNGWRKNVCWFRILSWHANVKLQILYKYFTDLKTCFTAFSNLTLYTNILVSLCVCFLVHSSKQFGTVYNLITYNQEDVFCSICGPYITGICWGQEHTICLSVTKSCSGCYFLQSMWKRHHFFLFGS